MSVEVHVKRRPNGDRVTVIELVGPTDTMRFADRMLEWQCDFGRQGRRILRSLRRYLGPDQFDGHARYLGLNQRTIAASKRPWGSDV